MDLKYSQELGQHQNCPPNIATPCRKIAFRFVHTNFEDSRNFLCPAKINPQRQFDARSKCDALSLSLFSSEENAKKFYEKLRRSNRNIGKTLGTCLALVCISDVDGLATP